MLSHRKIKGEKDNEEFKYVITDPEGIHARPTGELVKAAKDLPLISL